MCENRETYLRFALKSTVLVAIFWALWYWITGQVPMITSQQMTENWTINFPFGVSRFSDVLFVPIWSTILAMIYFGEGVFNHPDNAIQGRISCLFVAGLLIGLLFCWVSSDKPESTQYFLIGSLVMSVVVSVVSSSGDVDDSESFRSVLIFGLVLNLVFSLGLGLAYSLTLGLGLGLGLSVVFALVSGLGYILATVLLICVCCVCCAGSFVVGSVSRVLDSICKGICARI